MSWPVILVLQQNWYQFDRTFKHFSVIPYDIDDWQFFLHSMMGCPKPLYKVISHPAVRSLKSFMAIDKIPCDFIRYKDAIVRVDESSPQILRRSNDRLIHTMGGLAYGNYSDAVSRIYGVDNKVRGDPHLWYVTLCIASVPYAPIASLKSNWRSLTIMPSQSHVSHVISMMTPQPPYLTNTEFLIAPEQCIFHSYRAYCQRHWLCGQCYWLGAMEILVFVHCFCTHILLSA